MDGKSIPNRLWRELLIAAQNLINIPRAPTDPSSLSKGIDHLEVAVDQIEKIRKDWIRT